MNYKPPKITEHIINGEPVNVWHPEEKKSGFDGFSISMASGGWLTGVYDSIESALMGAELDINLNPDFYKLQKEVNHFDNGNRTLTVNDLKPLFTNVSK